MDDAQLKDLINHQLIDFDMKEDTPNLII